MIKKSLLVVSLLSLICFTYFVKHTIAQENPLEPPILGFNCGVPTKQGEEQLDINLCCAQQVNFNASIPGLSLFQGIPIVGELANGVINSYTNFQNVTRKDQYKISACITGEPENDSNGACYCRLTDVQKEIESIKKLCESYTKGLELKSCSSCVSKGMYYSGMGCIPLNVKDLIQNYIFTFGIGFAGMIALLCIIYSALIIQISQGNPERLTKAQENLTSCIIGLLLIIFSIFLLRLIGVEVLQLPGFAL